MTKETNTCHKQETYTYDKQDHTVTSIWARLCASKLHTDTNDKRDQHIWQKRHIHMTNKTTPWLQYRPASALSRCILIQMTKETKTHDKRDVYTWHKRPIQVTKATKTFTSPGGALIHVHLRKDTPKHTHPHTWQKRPVLVQKRPVLVQKRPVLVHMTKETCTGNNRDQNMEKSASGALMTWQKRPICMTKETCTCNKREQSMWQKRPHKGDCRYFQNRPVSAAPIHTHQHTDRQTHTHPHTHICTHTHKYQHTSTYTQTHTSTHKHTHAHTNTHTHTRKRTNSVFKIGRRVQIATAGVCCSVLQCVAVCTNSVFKIGLLLRLQRSALIDMTKKTHTCNKRDLYIWQKRPYRIFKIGLPMRLQIARRSNL